MRAGRCGRADVGGQMWAGRWARRVKGSVVGPERGGGPHDDRADGCPDYVRDRGRAGAVSAWGYCGGDVATMSDPGMAVLVGAVSVMALPLMFLAAWSLFKGLI